MKRSWRQARSTRHTLVRCALALAFVLMTACTQPGQMDRPIALTIGLPALEQNALFYIAEQEGFFQSNGLKVEIKDYDTGVDSLSAVMTDEVRVAVASEFAFLRLILAESPLVLVGSADRFQNDYILVQPDRGIQSPADLKGKTIGVTLHTINEFYLGRFLALNGIEMTDVTLLDLQPGDFLKALSEGMVDALIAWQPYIHQAQQKNPGLAAWPAQSNQAVYSVLACKREWLANNQEAGVRLLKALAEAEAFLVRDPEAAKEIVRQRLGYDSAYIESIWPDHQFSLTLNYSLVVAMTDEARWLIENNRVSSTSVPDFLAVIDASILKTVKPEAVEIEAE